jgi:hypothetical protein
MHFKVDQDHVTAAMALDREASGRTRPERHNLCLPRIDRGFDVVPVQVNSSATICRPVEFDRFALPDLDRRHIVSYPPVFYV